MPIDFLAIGHMTHDRTPDGFRLGGTVSYAAVTARRLGRRPGILTRAASAGLVAAPAAAAPANFSGPAGSPLAGIPICLLPSPVSTTFVNQYAGGQRIQYVEAIAGPILPEDLPPAWAAAPVVLLGPLAREIPPAWAGAFPKALVGITPQGWMRQWDASGRVRPAPWDNAEEFLAHVNVLILSREDVGGDDAALAHLMSLACPTCLMVVTDGWCGAAIYSGGERQHVAPRITQEVDPTGAGDVFATAFLICLTETGDPLYAARFANVTASMSVEGVGMTTIPERAVVARWLAEHDA